MRKVRSLNLPRHALPLAPPLARPYSALPLARPYSAPPNALTLPNAFFDAASGGDAMTPEQYLQFVRLHENGSLLAPALPADAIAVLALACPADWSGMFLTWNEDRVASLVHATPAPAPERAPLP